MASTSNTTKKRPVYPTGTFKEKIAKIIFGTDTVAGKTFDVALLVAILLSVLTVMLESVKEIRDAMGFWLDVIEWFFTIVFTLEYVARLATVVKPRSYAFSFFGIIDLISILPSYISLIFPGAEGLMIFRAFRLMRAFRVFKLVQFIGEAQALSAALKASRHKIIVFLGGVLSIVVIIGAMMHLIEGPENGFTSIPRGIYWAIVTITTVGYGDISPHTPLGQALAAILMIVGYGVIAVPTGIFSAEMAKSVIVQSKEKEEHPCHACGKDGHDVDSVFCKHCGSPL